MHLLPDLTDFRPPMRRRQASIKPHRAWQSGGSRTPACVDIHISLPLSRYIAGGLPSAEDGHREGNAVDGLCTGVGRVDACDQDLHARAIAIVCQNIGCRLGERALQRLNEVNALRIARVRHHEYTNLPVLAECGTEEEQAR
jgi:hypothetical protein